MVDRAETEAETQQVDEPEGLHHPNRLLDELAAAAERFGRSQCAAMPDPISVAVRHRDIGKFIEAALPLGVNRQHVLAPCQRDPRLRAQPRGLRSEEHTSELQSLMRISYAGFCLKK